MKHEIKRMNPVTKRIPSERPRYQYRLNDNHKGSDFASINNVNLTRDWVTFESIKHDLRKCVKTFNNREGEIDFRILNPLQEESDLLVGDSVNYDLEREIYSREVLTTLDRAALADIGATWLISPVKVRTPQLIDKIMKIQDTYLEYQKSLGEVEVDKEVESSINIVAKSIDTLDIPEGVKIEKPELVEEKEDPFSFRNGFPGGE